MAVVLNGCTGELLHMAEGKKKESVASFLANLNAAIDEVRRSEWRCVKAVGKKVLKGSRNLLMTGRESLDNSGLERLLELTRLNEKPSTDYIHKEEFRSIDAQSTSARCPPQGCGAGVEAPWPRGWVR